MVNFIKENLLGSVKEFRNRFINPIQNGQCADSTFIDVRVMKKRAHILYEMLAGCVQVRQNTPTVHSELVYDEQTCKNAYLPQRRDYSALTKFLPPKHEYVLAIRLSPIQCKLYRYYLDHFTGTIYVIFTYFTFTLLKIAYSNFVLILFIIYSGGQNY